MPSTPTEFVFSEPSGRPNALVQFAAAVVFAGLYAYAVSAGNAAGSSWLLVMAGSSVLSGVAESLAKGRRRAAGMLRLTAVLALTALVLSVFLAPGFIAG